jgi:two-component system, cell cycle sensor histidine kinase and response regulator CckA
MGGPSTRPSDPEAVRAHDAVPTAPLKGSAPGGGDDRWLSRLPAVLDNMREGLQILGFDWRYLYVNEAAAQHGRHSKEALLGRTLPEMYPGVEQSDMWRHLERCMRERSSHRMENLFEYPDGSTQWFELRMAPVPEGVLILSIDIGERRRLEAQLSHAQKMEAVGQLAGGVAHDFNNLLTIISTYAHFLADALPDGSRLAQDVAQIRAAADRGARLTRQLLALGRRQVLHPTVVSVNDALAELEPMLRRLMGEPIEVCLALSPSVGHVLVDAGQLDQVIMNLAVNARDAMPGGGRFTLRTSNARLDEAYCEQHPGVTPGSYVMVAVTDTGHGMDAETLERIFDPFFTTKGPTGGTGLGLATSHGIVRQTGGHIWVYSEVGHGTTFKLYFPRVEDAVVEAAAEPAPAPADLRGHETVIVVDDEEALRVLCARGLKEYGYTVLEAESPSEAIRFSERYSGPIQALVTDMVMPEMSGLELYLRLTRTRPDLRALFMSGYVDHALLGEVDPANHLEKPFTPETLARRLRHTLDQPPGD